MPDFNITIPQGFWDKLTEKMTPIQIKNSVKLHLKRIAYTPEIANFQLTEETTRTQEQLVLSATQNQRVQDYLDSLGNA